MRKASQEKWNAEPWTCHSTPVTKHEKAFGTKPGQLLWWDTLETAWALHIQISYRKGAKSPPTDRTVSQYSTECFWLTDIRWTFPEQLNAPFMMSHLCINKINQGISTPVRLGKPLYKIDTTLVTVKCKKYFQIINLYITTRRKTPLVFMLFLLTLKHVNYKHGNTSPHAILYSPRCQRKLKPFWKKIKFLQAPAFIYVGHILHNYVYVLYIYTLKYLKGKEYFSKFEHSEMCTVTLLLRT